VKNLLQPLVFIISVFVVACISDANRCGKGFVFREELPPGGWLRYCEKIEEETDTEADAGKKTDGGTDDSGTSTGDPLYGLGEPCFQPSDCAEFNATMCAGQPGAEGYCSVPGCSVNPDTCPKEYYCCNFLMVPSMGTFCVTKDDLESMGDMCE
jgi:hypothetical protein